jgi:hypothetical protein
MPFLALNHTIFPNHPIHADPLSQWIGNIYVEVARGLESSEQLCALNSLIAILFICKSSQLSPLDWTVMAVQTEKTGDNVEAVVELTSQVSRKTEYPRTPE